MGWGMKVSEGTRKGGVSEGCVLGLVEDGMEGWLVLISPGLLGSSPGKFSGLQVGLDFSNSSSACPLLPVVDS